MTKTGEVNSDPTKAANRKVLSPETFEKQFKGEIEKGLRKEVIFSPRPLQ